MYIEANEKIWKKLKYIYIYIYIYKGRFPERRIPGIQIPKNRIARIKNKTQGRGAMKKS